MKHINNESAIVEVDGLEIGYNKEVILQDISFRVNSSSIALQSWG